MPRQTAREPAHRAYVGGLWDEVGKLQFDFMFERGLRPEHRMIDVGCGCLRGGRHFIRYLDAGNYVGIDHHQHLLDAGVGELDNLLFEVQRPTLICEPSFYVDPYSMRKADFILAHSLWTHLAEQSVGVCMLRMRRLIRDDGVFYATYFRRVGSSQPANPSEDDDQAGFRHGLDRLVQLAELCRWSIEDLGEWGHPRRQRMLELRPR